MNNPNFQELITGNFAIDYINITTIIVNSIAIFASIVLIIFFILNIILRVTYKNLQQIIEWRSNAKFIRFPTGKEISVNDFYQDVKLYENKQKIDDEFDEFQKEMKNHEKKILIFKKIVQITITLIKYRNHYKKFMRLINNLRVLFCCFSNNQYDGECYLFFNGYYFQIKIIDTNYFQITVQLKNSLLNFNIRVTRSNNFKLCPNQNFDNDEQQKFINDFLTYFNKEAKHINRHLKRNLLIYKKDNWGSIDESTIENIKAYHHYPWLRKKYWIVKLNDFHITDK